jgi:hypothetical protein
MTATDEKAATLADLAAAIGDEDAAVADVLALVPEAALAKAWAAGGGTASPGGRACPRASRPS